MLLGIGTVSLRNQKEANIVAINIKMPCGGGRLRRLRSLRSFSSFISSLSK